MKKNILTSLACLAWIFYAAITSLNTAHAAVEVNIYGPGQNLINLALAKPIKGPNTPATGLASQAEQLVQQNMSILPFIALTSDSKILGGTTLAGYEPPSLDFKRFQLAGSDIVVTSFWPNDTTMQMRAFETLSGKSLFFKEYANIQASNLNEVVDRFSADLLEVIIGNGDLFRSTLAFVKKVGKLRAHVWTVRPTGRDLKQVTNLVGESMSPSWSPDGRYVVFTHIDDRSHGLGVWDRNAGSVQRIRFPGNIVIGPAYMPNNQVAVSLSNGRNPDIFLLNSAFQRSGALEQNDSINVSPTFDRSGTKMAFTSNRLGGPQIFLKDLSSGSVRRVSLNGGYNTEASLSPDGTLVAYSRMTDYGHRIFVQNLTTGSERQITFGPGSDEQPAFCGDNYSIAFTSSRGGQRGIYLTTRNGAAPKKINTGSGDASFPRWGMPR